MKTLIAIQCLFFLGLFCLVSCSSEIICTKDQIACDDTCIEDFDSTLNDIQLNIFQKGCAAFESCHTGSNAKEGLILSSTTSSYQSLVNKTSNQNPDLFLIHPGNSEKSYVIHKVTGENIAVSKNGKPYKPMPFGTEGLCQAKIDKLKTWINNGAKQE